MNFIFMPGGGESFRLRMMAHTLGCSVAEAHGILYEIWMFADYGADQQGFVDMAQLWSTISPDLLKGTCRDEIEMALLSAGFIEMAGDMVLIVGWSEAQMLKSQINKSEQRKVIERERKRKEYNLKKQGVKQPKPEEPKVEIKPQDPPPEPPKPEPKPKKEKPPKKKYAEFVHMTVEQHQKLVSEYGEAAAAEMVRLLDNYKGSKGKTYKDDYRAILTWVVDAVKERNPSLFRAPAQQQWHNDNPF